MSAQIAGNAFIGRFHGVFSFRPVCRTYFAELFEMLQCVNHTDRLVDVTSQRQVVDYIMADLSLLIDQEQAAISNGSARGYHFAFFVGQVIGASTP